MFTCRDHSFPDRLAKDFFWRRLFSNCAAKSSGVENQDSEATHPGAAIAGGPGTLRCRGIKSAVWPCVVVNVESGRCLEFRRLPLLLPEAQAAVPPVPNAAAI